ncbi:MAG: hypothetical protein J5966_00440, partial [Lachnospiraceae bacterium]|nr:hypothetical protein [Lachnospiraceae bacterium]
MQYGQDDEREINLLEIVWEFFIQWKPALVFSLILAVLVSGVMYVKNEISYRSQLAAYEKGRDFADKDIEKEKRLLEAELTDSEIRKVENEIYNKQLLKYNEEKLEKISGYDLANNRMDYAVIRYSISTDNIPVTGLLTTYRDVAYDDSLMEKLIAENGVYADLLNMTDIVTISYSDRPDAENNNYNTFAVNIALPDGIDEKRVEKIVTDYIEGSQKELQNVIPHKLELVSTGVTTSLSTALTDQVLALRDKIQSLKNTISTDVSAFSDEQEELYYYMLFENDLLEEEDEPVKTEGFSKKFPVIGFAAGIFIYAMLLVC